MRVLAVGNMYPPHHLGGYELVWRSAMRFMRQPGDCETRVLCSDLRLQTGALEPEDPDTFRELRWYWRDHAWPRFSWRERLALERANTAVLARHLADFKPDVVAWWSMGGMSLSLMEQVRREKIPAVGFVADDWLLYAPIVDGWTGPFRRANRIPGLGRALAAVAELRTGIPAWVSLDAVAGYVLISETVRLAARGSGLKLAGVEHRPARGRRDLPRPAARAPVDVEPAVRRPDRRAQGDRGRDPGADAAAAAGDADDRRRR